MKKRKNLSLADAFSWTSLSRIPRNVKLKNNARLFCVRFMIISAVALEKCFALSHCD